MIEQDNQEIANLKRNSRTISPIRRQNVGKEVEKTKWDFSTSLYSWEQRKLNDLVTIRRGLKSLLVWPENGLDDDILPVVRANNINDDQFITSDDDKILV